MPLSHPPHEADFTLTFNDNKFNISKCLFGLYSIKFRNHPDFIFQNSLDMSEKGIDVSTFQQFVNACQSHFYSITNENVIGLHFLCKKWKVPMILEEVVSYLSDINDSTLLITKLNFLLQKDAPTSEIEETISKHINSYLSVPSFCSLPIPVLHRIISKTFLQENKTSTNKNRKVEKINHHLFLNFLKAASDFHKESAAPLYYFVDGSDFTHEEINEIGSKPKFIQHFLEPTFSTSISSLFQKLNDQKNQITSINSQIESMKNFEGAKITEFKEKVAKLKKSIKKKVKNLANEGMESSSSNQALHELEQQISTITTSITTSNDTLSMLETKCADLDNLYNEVYTRVFTMATPNRQEQRQEKQQQRKKRSRMSFFPSKQDKDEKEEPHSRRTVSMKEPDHKRASFLEAKTQQRNAHEMPVRNSVAPSMSQSIETTEVTKEFNATNQLNGIIKQLTQQCGGNVHKEKIIDIQASSSLSSQAPMSVCDYNNVWFWSTKDQPNQWLRFDFKNRKISLKNYTIKTIPYQANFDHLKNWVVEGTNNLETGWDEIDKRTNNSDLNGSGSIFTFKCESNANSYRYIRLRTIGPNHYGKNILALTNIEFFGNLK
ncbi:hypothetical protein TRFO_05865 [Tritrichomonas foetus]|uniref:F5/8 type C domain-containing protein n=1 Tax=Tritrichomonas foetus TaxID=1144522 RepID=A0A1J4K8F6_9EUKA|nr:hypothetical protein TRFO_05865 [Tritrichomonas foetus]|eukprot:OHT05709.1 hypothetical protein TRFO_05865 [Tritrichomonas foetus]